jgi:tetratricopeptide (TPR) repeat protein
MTDTSNGSTSVSTTQTASNQGGQGGQGGQAVSYTLEQGQRFSRSLLWGMSREFYDQKGLTAWDSGVVPSYVTSNAFIAQAYAHVVLQYLRDCAAAKKDGDCAIDPSKPIYIVELAAGHARFSYLFLKKFFALKDASSLKSLDIRYVMTDFTESNVRSWEWLALFDEFRKRGVLEMGLFELERDEEIRLIASGRPLSRLTVENPLVVFGNYIFDSLAQDFFRAEGGELHEVLLTTRHTEPLGSEAVSPDVMSQFQLTWDTAPLSGAAYYGDPQLDRILNSYRTRLSDTTFVFPVGPMRALRTLLEMANQRLLVLTSDKGYTHEDELFYINTPHVQFHGAISTMVNYHALGQLVGELGGTYLATEQRQLSLKTVALRLGGNPEQFADTELAFQEFIDRFGPYDFYTLANQVRSLGLSAEGAMELIRLSQFDPQVFLDHEKVLLDQASSLSETQRVELQVILEGVWENAYPLGRDVPFELGRVFLAMRKPREALRYNELSLKQFGEHHVTYCNMGICHYQAEDIESAVRCFERSLSIAPDYGLPKAWLARISGERAR